MRPFSFLNPPERALVRFLIEHRMVEGQMVPLPVAAMALKALGFTLARTVAAIESCRDTSWVMLRASAEGDPDLIGLTPEASLQVQEARRRVEARLAKSADAGDTSIEKSRRAK